MTYQFGTYQQPTGLETVSRSRQIASDAMVLPNWDLQPIDARVDANEWAIEPKNLDTKSITQINNPGRRFEEMIESGWGGAERNDKNSNDSIQESTPFQPPKDLPVGSEVEVPAIGCRVEGWQISEIVSGQNTNRDQVLLDSTSIGSAGAFWRVMVSNPGQIVANGYSGFTRDGQSYALFFQRLVRQFTTRLMLRNGFGGILNRNFADSTWQEFRRSSEVPYGGTSGISFENAFVLAERSIESKPWLIIHEIKTEVRFPNCNLETFPLGVSSPPANKTKTNNGMDPCCIDYNVVATIIEDKIANIDRDIKDHIDRRTIEELKAVNKMLQGMQIDLNLQPVIDRLNQVEANLWNGPRG